MKRTCSLFCLLLGIQSALSQISIVGDLSQDHEARPGEQYSGTFVVRNDSQKPQYAKVYQTDYFFQRDGTNRYGEPGTEARSNAPWIMFTAALFSVPPQGTVPVNFTVSVPPDSTGTVLKGTYWSMLMVEGTPEVSGLTPDGKKKEMGLQQLLRYGIQVATTITGTGSRKVKFLDVTLQPPENGKRMLRVDIENTGEIGFRPDVYVELFDSKGTSIGKFPGLRYRLYPGTSVREQINLTTVPPGEYRALVVVDPGGEDAFGAQYTLTF